MAVLIVDDEDNTREVLRDFLVSLGHKTILEAHNGVEALKLLDQKKSPIQIIISDWDMPEMNGLDFLDHVAKRQEMNLIPFVLISSDLSQEATEIMNIHPRLDGTLRKPFRANALQEHLKKSYIHRNQSRHSMIYVGPSIDPTLLSLVQNENPEIWSKIFHAQSLQKLEEVVQQEQHLISAVIIEPSAYEKFQDDWLDSFKKTRHGNASIVICLSRQPGIAQSLKLYSDIFLEAPNTADEWRQILQQAAHRLLNSWEREMLNRELKSLLHNKDYKTAQKIGERMLKIDDKDSGANSTMGDIVQHRGEVNKAISYIERSIELNPFLPGGYLKIFDLRDHLSTETLFSFTEKASQFCARNCDVLWACAQAYADRRDLGQAHLLHERILKLQPQHPGVISLRSKLPKK